MELIRTSIPVNIDQNIKIRKLLEKGDFLY